jgi:hypothetical protein
MIWYDDDEHGNLTWIYAPSSERLIAAAVTNPSLNLREQPLEEEPAVQNDTPSSSASDISSCREKKLSKLQDCKNQTKIPRGTPGKIKEKSLSSVI